MGPSAIRPRSSISLQSLLHDVGPRLRERMLQSQRFCLFNVSRMHVYVREVLHGVLYPKVHMKSISKKKKRGLILYKGNPDNIQDEMTVLMMKEVSSVVRVVGPFCTGKFMGFCRMVPGAYVSPCKAFWNVLDPSIIQCLVHIPLQCDTRQNNPPRVLQKDHLIACNVISLEATRRTPWRCI